MSLFRDVSHASPFSSVPSTTIGHMDKVFFQWLRSLFQKDADAKGNGENKSKWIDGWMIGWVDG